LAQGKDLSSYEGWATYAKELGQNNDLQGAVAAADRAKGFQKTGQIQARVQALINKGVAANQTEAEAIASDDAAFREAMGLNKKTTAERLMSALQAEAEKKFGFHLYQGGIVPGNSLRVVNIEGVDTEACCGTHCDNTAEVGWIRVIKS
jgi:hypothetical protein